MNYLKQALMELLSGLTTKKNEKEIWIKHNGGVDIFDITVEPVDDECYIVREYWANGQLWYEKQYNNNNQLYGFYKSWFENGKMHMEAYYKDNLLHGVCKIWDKEGNVVEEYEFENGKTKKILK